MEIGDQANVPTGSALTLAGMTSPTMAAAAMCLRRKIILPNDAFLCRRPAEELDSFRTGASRREKAAQ